MKRRADQRNHHIIYKTVRFDGKYYIGMHSTDDLNDGYLGSGSRLWHSIKYHGKEKHTREILEHLPTRKALIQRERELVTEELLKDPMCLNLALGGLCAEYKKPDTEQAKRNKSQAIKKFYASEAGQIARAKISSANKGQTRTAEAKRACSESAKKRMARMQADGSWEAVKAKNAQAHYGKVQTEETKRRRTASIAQARRRQGGKFTFSEQARANISAGLIGSARNVKTWVLTAADGSEHCVQNLQQWVRDQGLQIIGYRIFDETGTKYRARSNT